MGGPGDMLVGGRARSSGMFADVANRTSVSRARAGWPRDLVVELGMESVMRGGQA